MSGGVLCILVIFLSLNHYSSIALAKKHKRSSFSCGVEETHVHFTYSSADWHADLRTENTAKYNEMLTIVTDLLKQSTSDPFTIGTAVFSKSNNNKVAVDVCMTFTTRRVRKHGGIARQRRFDFSIMSNLASQISKAAADQGVEVGDIEVKYENKKLGHPCTEGTDDCFEPNAICTDDKTCICEPLNYVEKFGDLETCYERKEYGEVCEFSEQCSSPQTCGKNCASDEVCDTVCKCEDGSSYIASRSNCYPVAVLNDKCVINEQCENSVANSICLSQYCKCITGYEEYNSGCRKSSLGGFCMTSDTCRDPNTDCIMSACTCSSAGFVQKPGDTDTCYEKKSYTEVCEFNEQCGGGQECSKPCAADQVCDNQCQCLSGYSYVNAQAKCYEDIPLGGSCDISAQCSNAVSDSACKRKICECMTGYEQHADGCRKASLGGYCKGVADTCRDPNTVCSKTECTCNPVGFVQKPGDFDTCYETKSYTEICEFSEQCGGGQTCSKPCPSDQVCDNVCQCMQGYSYVSSLTACYKDVPLGGACDITEECTNAVVDSVCKRKTCECKIGYEQHQGGCRKASLGGYCKDVPDMCRDPNTVCTKSKCTCNPDGFVQKPGDVDTCYETKSYTEVCDFLEQCGESQTCSKPCASDQVCDKVCQCPPGFSWISSMTACYEDVPLGGSCSFSEQCSNKVNYAECKSKSCACMVGYIQENLECSEIQTTTPAAESSTAGGVITSASTSYAGASTSTGAMGTSTEAASTESSTYFAENSTGAYGSSTTLGYVTGSSSTSYAGASTSTGAIGTSTEAASTESSTYFAGGSTGAYGSSTTLGYVTGSSSTNYAGASTSTGAIGSSTAQQTTTMPPTTTPQPTTTTSCPVVEVPGDSCDASCSCSSDLYLTCVDGTCQCEDAYVNVVFTCLERKNFGDPCTYTEQCPSENTCRGVVKICDCPEGSFTPDQLNCYEYRDLGQSCDISEQCTDFSECKDDTKQCTCRPNFSVHVDDANTCTASFLLIDGSMNFDSVVFTADHLQKDSSAYSDVKTSFESIMSGVGVYDHYESLDLSENESGNVKAAYIIAIWSPDATRPLLKRFWYPGNGIARKRHTPTADEVAAEIKTAAAASGQSVSNVQTARADLDTVCTQESECDAFDNAVCDVAAELCICDKDYKLNSAGDNCE